MINFIQHYLTYKDETSDKFWNIDANGQSFTVTYGKTGTPGQTQTKEFKDEATCLKEAKKLLNEKLKKGYAEKQASKRIKAICLKKAKSKKVICSNGINLYRKTAAIVCHPYSPNIFPAWRICPVLKSSFDR
ncbi:WGR domain-containing protein [Leptospira weilii]|uniref:WGR domain-containing protein n=1 Tax=Leptospira weilii TaxID=28184 RepID=UPI003B983763